MLTAAPCIAIRADAPGLTRAPTPPRHPPGQAQETSGVWLGRKDSNLRIREPKSRALPLGHAPFHRGARPVRESRRSLPRRPGGAHPGGGTEPTGHDSGQVIRRDPRKPAQSDSVADDSPRQQERVSRSRYEFVRRATRAWARARPLAGSTFRHARGALSYATARGLNARAYSSRPTVLVRMACQPAFLNLFHAAAAAARSRNSPNTVDPLPLIAAACAP